MQKKTESDITDEESDNESDNLSVAIDSSDDFKHYIQNDEHSLLSKDGKYNWVDIIPEMSAGKARAYNKITAHLGKYYPYVHQGGPYLMEKFFFYFFIVGTP